MGGLLQKDKSTIGVYMCDPDGSGGTSSQSGLKL